MILAPLATEKHHCTKIAVLFASRRDAVAIAVGGSFEGVQCAFTFYAHFFVPGAREGECAHATARAVG